MSLKNIRQDKTKKKSAVKRNGTLLVIKLVFHQKHLNSFCIILYCMELEFYLKRSTGKSYSNIKISQRPYVNEGLNVANI